MDNSRKHTPISELVDYIKLQVSIAGFTLEEYPYEDIKEVFQYLSHGNLPMGVIMYSGSTFKDEPARNPKFTILIIAQNYSEDNQGIRTYMDISEKVISALDFQLYKGQALLKIESDRPVNIENNSGTIGCAMIVSVEDN